MNLRSWSDHMFGTVLYKRQPIFIANHLSNDQLVSALKIICIEIGLIPDLGKIHLNQ